MRSGRKCECKRRAKDKDRSEGLIAGVGKVISATVDSVQSIDNMATLPVSQRQHGGVCDVTPERNNSANKDLEAKKDKKPGKDPSEPKRYLDSPAEIILFFYGP